MPPAEDDAAVASPAAPPAGVAPPVGDGVPAPDGADAGRARTLADGGVAPTPAAPPPFTLPPLPAAQVRYVAADGDDGNAGNADHPLRTIGRCAALAGPGDTCAMRAGVYRETVHPARPGRPDAPIVFRPVSAGDVVVVSGADPVEGWAPHQGAIWKAHARLPVTGYADGGFPANQVFVAGQMVPEARWPNAGPDPMRPKLASGGLVVAAGRITISSASLPAIPGGWVGGVVWTQNWYTARTGTIVSEAPGSVTATPNDPGSSGGFWYYLTGRLGALDSEGEWAYDGADLYLWPPGGGPPRGVEAKQRTLAFDLTDRSYVVVRGLRIFAATVATGPQSTGVVLEGLDLQYVSHHVTLPPPPREAVRASTANVLMAHAHDTGVQLRGTGNVLRDSRIAFSAGNGVLLDGSGHTVDDVVIRTVDTQGSYAAGIQVAGRGHRITHVDVADVGRSAIDVGWVIAGTSLSGVEIAYGEFSRWGALSGDLGAIYVCCGNDLTGSTIHHNRFHDPFVFDPFYDVAAIYLDLDAHDATVHHNVVWNIGGKHARAFKGGSPKGQDQVAHNTFMPASSFGAGAIVRDNILGQVLPAPFTGGNNLLPGTDPRFTGAASGDFTLAPGSPAIDTGVPLPGIDDGFVGRAPDLGAYERGAPAWTAGVVAP